MTAKVGKHITVALIPSALDDLQQLQERTSMSKTDLANRAITSYQFFDAWMRAGNDVIVRDNHTGLSRIVQLV
jgi:hypothetical protein